MSIENVVAGISVETYDEGLDPSKNPAKVVIRRQVGKEAGKTAAIVYAVVTHITGADGGKYPAVKFELRGKEPLEEVIPIQMILPCPACKTLHIDREESVEQFETRRTLHFKPTIGQVPSPIERWSNPPHKTHLCKSCGAKWRPANVPTVGVSVETITKGKEDNLCWEDFTH